MITISHSDLLSYACAIVVLCLLLGIAITRASDRLTRRSVRLRAQRKADEARRQRPQRSEAERAAYNRRQMLHNSRKMRNVE